MISQDSVCTHYILIDGSSYLHRAYHALPPLSTSTGQPTWVIRGVVSMLKKIQKTYQNSTIITIFDAKGKNFRHTLYPEYKIHRESMPEDLREQIEPLFKIIKAMGFPLMSIEGVEADDVIGTLAYQLAEQGHKILISSSDKDLAQLVQENITLVDTMKNSVLDISGVTSKFGVPPHLIIDLLALQGDASDNIPGVPKVGSKTAVSLLNEIAGLDAIYANIDQVALLPIRGAKSLAEQLKTYKDQAYLSYQLATIKTDVVLDDAVNTWIQTDIQTDLLKQYFEVLEFRTWLNELSDQQHTPAKISMELPDIILTETFFNQWFEKITQADLVAFDTETTALDYMTAELVGMSFSIHAESMYLPCGHDRALIPNQLPLDWVLQKLKPWFESPKHLKIGQNIKYDHNVLARYGIQLNGMMYDTMLESYILDSTAVRHNLFHLAQFYLNQQTIQYTDVVGVGSKQLTFDQVPLEDAAVYAAEDARVTYALHEVLSSKLKQNEKQWHVYEKIEQPLIAILAKMERRGTLIDCKKLAQHHQDLTKQLTLLKEVVFSLSNQEFNINSPKQLQVILFEKLQFPIIKKTPKGQPATSEEVLNELALEYELPKKILEYRSISKLMSTYTDKLPKKMNAKTKRVHTSYHQAVTATGRLSSSEPNLQNIPIRTQEGRRIRQAFIAESNYCLVAADYSQIELRIMAHLSRDARLLEAFLNHEDVHRATASDIFNISASQVTSDQRRSAKAINFGLIYGMSAFGLAKQLSISRASAQQYIDSYFNQYPGVRIYMDNTREIAKQQGFVETLYGRKLYLRNLQSREAKLRHAAERSAINAPLQGSAADIIKMAMIDIDAYLTASNYDAHMIMQVHDELVFEVKVADREPVCQAIQSLMKEVVTLAIPLVVDIGYGNNWDEAH